MSHNKIKVGLSEPNRNSEYNVSVSQLSDISGGTPNNGDFLQYNGTNWNPVGSSNIAEVIFIGEGASENYSTSPATTISAGDTIYIYDSSPFNSISGATITKTNNWIESITLPSGKYIINAQATVTYSASGYVAYRLYNGSTFISSIGVDGANRSTYAPSNPLAIGFVDLSSQSTINFEVVSVSNIETVANQGTTISQHGLIYIEKVG